LALVDAAVERATCVGGIERLKPDVEEKPPPTLATTITLRTLLAVVAQPEPLQFKFRACE
jgi:hypothetical protein